jgi:predicted nucleic acid-binding protein
MPFTVILDSGPLGVVTNPKKTSTNEACQQWLDDLLAAEVRVIVPEIADYEVRRELLRANRTVGLARLDRLIASRGNDYLPITTPMMRHAAALWAQARQQGKQTAADAALDADVILIAQALSLDLPPDQVIIATHNVSDIVRFFPADTWENISP